MEHRQDEFVKYVVEAVSKMIGVVFLNQRLGRFVRETLSFSKSGFFHDMVLKLFIDDYNLSVA